MKRVARIASLLTFVVCVAAICLFSSGPALAQEEGPAIHVSWPNEGETLYAGPTSLLYSVPIRGAIDGGGSLPAGTELVMTVVRDRQPVGSLAQKVIGDEFEFLVTVNPQGSDGDFPNEHLTCADDCHLPGKMDLVPGELTLQFALTAPDGTVLASAERGIVVDYSQFVSIPVNLVAQDGETPVPAGVTIRGAAWLYLWRARHALGQTPQTASGSGGQAHLQVEALSQAPTEYLIEVEPTIVDGVLYEGLDSHRVTLQPGAPAPDEPITLTVSATRGVIAGRVTPATTAGAVSAGDIWAICPDGHSLQAPIAADGSFAFEDVPLDRYRLALDNQRLASQGFQQAGHTYPVDLTLELSQEATIQLAAVAPAVYRGHITTQAGQLLPFAWVSAGDGSRAYPVLPATGEYVWPGAPDRRTVVVVQAPGYYSRAASVNPATPGAKNSFSLTPRPGTTTLAWGDGALVLPDDADISRTSQPPSPSTTGTLAVQRGWLWGGGASDRPVVIQVERYTISIRSGQFALEYLPPHRGWFYLLEGEAQLTQRNGREPLVIAGGQMVNLFNQSAPVAVPYDPVVVRALQEVGAAPLAPSWEPTIQARLRDGVARMGVGAAQIITFVTYFLVCISILLLPAYRLYLRASTKKYER